jgi:hypothetical protein
MRRLYFDARIENGSSCTGTRNTSSGLCSTTIETISEDRKFPRVQGPAIRRLASVALRRAWEFVVQAGIKRFGRMGAGIRPLSVEKVG